MKELSYLTRGDSSPDHKPKVYFTSHPDDFEVYFRVLSGEILERSNCAIYYAEYERSIDDEEHRDNLAAMQLLVFPITSRFLKGENIARQEVRFAIENNIPVLPIMVESDLDKKFSKECSDIGNLQFVDRTSSDVTAMGYGERLTRYLNAVLVSDDKAEKIRAAFDMHTFLSYRKTKRAEAQRLMRLIHSDGALRDIAIWYDEFLVPGENFNEAIEDEIRRSQAFILAVTQNLLEKGNYVLTEEYPLAKKLNIQILPFELEETDPDISRIYEGLPECVKADKESVRRCMLEAYHAHVEHPAERNPVHNFLIGLAFLNGINVEKNTGIATELITDSAEKGLPEAMEQLVTMYREGDGVRRDHDKAIKWLKRCAERYGELAAEDESFDAWLSYYRAQSDLINYYIQLSRYTEAEAECGSLEEESLRRGEMDCYISVLYRRAKSAQGKSLQEASDDEWQRLYIKCCEYCRKVYERNQSKTALQILAQCYLELGRAASDRLQFTIAREYFERCIGYFRHLVQAYRNANHRELLSVVLSEHAETESFLKKPETAQREISEALELGQALYDEYLTPDLCKLVADLHMKMGGMLKKKGDNENSHQEYSLAEELYNEYSRKTESEGANSALFNLYENVAEFYTDEGRLDMAGEYLRRWETLAESLRDKLAKTDSDAVSWRISLGKAGLLAAEGSVTEAMDMYVNVYKSIESASADSEALKKLYQGLLFIAAAMACFHAENNNLKDYADEYGKKMESMNPLKSMISMPSIRALKELWSRSVTADGVNFNMLSTFYELYGDAIGWRYSDNTFFKTKLQPILKWLRAWLYLWRIPFYPVLSMFLLILIHLMNGYMDFRLPLRCWDSCLTGQTLYQCIASVMMAVCFAAVRIRQNHRKLLSFMAALLSCAVSVICVSVISGLDSLIPEISHVTFLILPLFSGIEGCIATVVTEAFLDITITD